MITRKMLHLGSLIGCLSWFYQPHPVTFFDSNTIPPLGNALQVVLLQNSHRGKSQDEGGSRVSGEHIIANSQVYNPPADSRISGGNHAGGGVRGCGDNVVAIAPRLSIVGQTSSLHPTLVWYNQSDANKPLALRLYRYAPSDNLEEAQLEELWTRPIGESRQGLMSYTIPSDGPGLMVGETYRWQVLLYCDAESLEVGTWTSADIEVLPTPEGLVAELSANEGSHAEVFARAGLWYEAMAAVYEASTPAAESLRRELLLDLASLEAETDTDETEDVSELLHEIASTL